MNPVAIIDFEASCLPEDCASYPIEIVLAKVGGLTRSWLIKPLPRWRFWDWSPDAEALHGISQSMLWEHGQCAQDVLDELVEEARGYEIYADCDLDAYWMEILCEGCNAPLPFPILHLGHLLAHEGKTRSEVLSALQFARGHLPAGHKPRHDASRLAIAVEYIHTSPSAA